ncbi:F510_1955 family glycosylhydrolase [Streptomyces sp. NPDC090029]|uniref:F510_1955 family glycosylhydrolase n=1 Tax=Streptomyces sp. NPDC090029 TaxID=3365924 RepID=UPI0037FE5AED
MNATTRTRAVTTAALLALTLSACSAATGGTDTGRTGGDDPSAAAGARTPQISHVHALGVDPADQRLYAATHDGIFTPGKGGVPERVGDSADDFMGFTVAGPNRFLASGHPAPGSDGPAHHGLIESRDAGRTWKPLSLRGEADFHALEHVDGTLYGYDSTGARLRVSEDGAAWDDRARLQALDIAVHPGAPDTVLATTADGIARSTDGGRTFAAGGQPVMAFLSWAEPGALYGLDGSGGLHRSPDAGATWEKTGTVPGGRPQAVTAVDAERVLAATGDGVYESTDGGRSFTQRIAVGGDGH